jgi:hypothetical protein
VLRKRRGAIGGDLPACIKTVARMPHCVAFCTDFWQAGPRRQKPFAIGKRDGERSANGGGKTIVARVFVAGGKG